MIRSFYNQYGALSISIIMLAMFGQFGLRPSQTKHKCLAYVLDVWFLYSYIVVSVPCLLVFGVYFNAFHLDFNQIYSLYSTIYIIIIFITCTLWLVSIFKKYNIFCLLEDVVSNRKATLVKSDIFCIAVIYIMFGTVFIINGVLPIVAMNLNISHLDIFFIALSSLFVNISWMLMWNITLLMCVMTLIISKEFKKCITDLNIISEERSLCSDEFLKASERFRELSLVVNKLDSMFSFAVGIILSMDLGTLCIVTYAVVTGENPTMWYIATVYSALSLGFLLFSLSTLNNRVRNFSHLT